MTSLKIYGEYGGFIETHYNKASDGIHIEIHNSDSFFQAIDIGISDAENLCGFLMSIVQKNKSEP